MVAVVDVADSSVRSPSASIVMAYSVLLLLASLRRNAQRKRNQPPRTLGGSRRWNAHGQEQVSRSRKGTTLLL